MQAIREAKFFSILVNIDPKFDISFWKNLSKNKMFLD